MKGRPAAVLLVPTLAILLVLSPGCVSRQNRLLRTEIQDLQNRLYELQKKNAEAQVEIQELRERTGAALPAPSGAEGPSAAAAAASPASSEPVVPGSTIDLGEEGPTRNVETAPADAGGAPAGPAAGGEGSQAVAPSGPSPATGSGEADKLYIEGYSQFNSGDLDAAEQSFQKFLSVSPESDLADDAQFFVGECYFSRKDYRRAILEFRKVVDKYPFGNRVPHAFLRIGLAYLALGDRDRAAENLETVVQAFPKSDVATVARATLSEIKKP